MKIKNKIFKSKFSDMQVELYTSGFMVIRDEYGAVITIGVPPNARTQLILDAIKYVEKGKKK